MWSMGTCPWDSIPGARTLLRPLEGGTAMTIDDEVPQRVFGAVLLAICPAGQKIYGSSWRARTTPSR